MKIKQEVMSLPSRYPDQTLMYPGRKLFTWVQVSAHLPWMLVKIEDLP